MFCNSWYWTRRQLTMNSTMTDHFFAHGYHDYSERLIPDECASCSSDTGNNILRHRQQQRQPKAEALAVATASPSSSSGGVSGGARFRPAPAPPASQRAAVASSRGRRSMPKLLHALCCCLRPRAYNKKHHDASTGGDYSDSRASARASGVVSSSSPITQQQPLKPSGSGRGASAQQNVSTIKLVSDIRQRLSPRQQQQDTLQQRRQISNGNNNNNAAGGLTVVLGPEQKQPQQPRQLTVHHHPPHPALLPRVAPQDVGKNCLIVDLDETLVHSSFKPVKNADFIIPVEIDNVVHQVYVLKRPHTDQFLERVGALFECVLFTASLAKYADPVADLLDKRRVFRTRLFRESCVFYEGNYVKDLERLGRDLRKIIIIDNSPASYSFHPDNAIPVRTWFDDPGDRELLDLLPLLEELAHVDDVYAALHFTEMQGQQQSQQPRCLTPSDDMLLPPPMAPSSPITQVLPPSNTSNNNRTTPWTVKESLATTTRR